MKWFAGCCGRIFSRSCTSNFLPTRRTMPTSFCRRRHFLSTKICRKRTGTIICRFRIRRSRRWASAVRTWKCFARWPQRMGFEEDCFRETVDEMIDAALDSEDPWLEGISRERLERGQVRLNFGAANSQVPASGAELRSAGQPGAAVPTYSDAHPEPFLPFARGGFRTPSGKAELYSEAVKRWDSIRSPTLLLLPNRGTEETGRTSAGTAGPQGRQLPELHILQRAVGSGDGRDRSAGDLLRPTPGARHRRMETRFGSSITGETSC